MVNALIGKNDKPRWSPTELYPELDSKQSAERLAEYFNSISNEYSPLDMAQIEPTWSKPIKKIEIEDVVKKFKKAKLKTSSVPGDLPPDLYKLYPDKLAVPARVIFNRILDTNEWPRQWTVEHVTICLLYTSPSPRDRQKSRMPSSA